MKPRRGVSEIVASMVVLMIVSVLGVMLYNISMSNMNNQRNNLFSDIQTKEDIAQERYEIVSVNSLNEKKVIIYLYNYGAVDVIITDIYLNFGNSVIPQRLIGNEPTVVGVILPASQLTNIPIDCDPRLSSDVTKYTIVSEKGVSVEYSVS